MADKIFQARFKKGQLVVVKCYDSYFDAKIIDINEVTVGDIKYKIHYQGWSKLCDEWVWEKQLLDADVDNTNQHKKKKGMKHKLILHYPDQIKKLLIDDDKNNFECKKFMKNIPRKNGQRIYDILINYSSEYNVKNDKIKKQILNYIRFFFNESLPKVLLYNNERAQYLIISKKLNNLSMDQIYGVEHLCRLFIKLPILIANNDLNYKTKVKLEEIIQEIMTHICCQLNKYLPNK